MFSAVICTYIDDNPRLLEHALSSLHTQDLLPTEVILVQDGPICSEAKIVILLFKADLEEKNIIFKHHIFSLNVGHGQARRCGIDIATHDVIAICDADDLNDITRFKKQFSFLERNPGISIVGAYVEETINGETNKVRMVKESHEDIVTYCKFRCPMNQMTVMFRKKAIIKAGGYKDFYHNEDYYLWIRLIVKGFRFSNIPEVLVTASVDSNTYKRRGGFRYFISEIKIQTLMLKHNITTLPIYVMSIIIRILVQLIIPNKLRKWLFLKYFRSYKNIL